MLTEQEVKSNEPGDKPYKLFDGQGLYLLVKPNGSRLWRLKYRFDSKEKVLALGKYPDVRLKAARNKRSAARRLLAEEGIDPCAQRKAEKIARLVANAGTFKAIASEWIEADCPGPKRKKGRPTKETIRQLELRLEKYVYPAIGHKPILDVTLQDLRAVLVSIGKRGKHETAHRVRSLCDRIFRYAVATERASRNIAADLKGTLTSSETQGFAAITKAKPFGALLRSIDAYEGQPTTMAALKLAPLVFVRPGELRAAEWAEIDVDEERWSIPQSRMKEKLPHEVPLSIQALTIIEELRPITGHCTYLFPSLRSTKRPISDNTLNAAMRRMGISKDQMTAHGFRKSASTLLHEMGYSPEIIETQLAHKRLGVAGIYNKSLYIKQRTEMMQAWADYLDNLKTK